MEIKKSHHKKKEPLSEPKPFQFIQPPAPPESTDLGEATGETVKSLQNETKLPFITEIQSLDELRLVTYALTEAKYYKEDFQKDYFTTYLLYKTSYMRKRTLELIQVIKSAEERVQALRSGLGGLILGNNQPR